MEESPKGTSNIVRRLTLLIVLFFVVVLAVGGLSLYLARSISRSAQEITLQSKHIELTEAIHSTVHHLVFELSRVVITGNLDRVEHMNELQKELNLRIADFSKTHGGHREASQEMRLFRQVQELVGQLEPLSARVVGQVGKGTRVTREDGERLDLTAHLVPVLTKALNDIHHADVRKIVTSSERKMNTIVYIYFGFLLGGIFLVAISNVYFSRRIAFPLRRLAQVTKDIAAGDFKRRVPVASKDDIGQLSHSFNLMTERLEAQEEMRKGFQQALEETVQQRTKELRETQDHLVQLEKLKVIGEMYAGLTHEINNPLGIIVSKVKMLLTQGRQESYPAEMVKELEMIDRHSARIAQVIRSLLTFARKAEFELTPLNLNDTINETIGLVKEPFAKMNIAIKDNLEENLPLINGNANQLQQVFLNFLTNARDALPEGGTISIWTYRDLEDKGRVKAEFIDNGIGIAPENLGRIFEPFFTTKEVGKGTGLGLSVSFGIIRAHGGDIKVKSEPGKGSAFTLMFPSLREDKGDLA